MLKDGVDIFWGCGKWHKRELMGPKMGVKGSGCGMGRLINEKSIDGWGESCG